MDLVMAVGAVFGGIFGVLSGVVILGLAILLMVAPYFALKRETEEKHAPRALDAKKDYFAKQY